MLLKSDKAIAALKKHFKKNKLAQLKELSATLGTSSRMSIFRRLSKLDYISSYTHAGSYYSLSEAIHFDENGLWYHEGVGFSEHGNLKKTIVELIELSPNGRTQAELQSQLHIRVHNTLLDLCRCASINWSKINGVKVYVSSNIEKSKTQLLHRDTQLTLPSSEQLTNWLIIDVLVAIIQCSRKEIVADEILKKLAPKNRGITLEHINRVIEKFNLKKTLGL